MSLSTFLKFVLVTTASFGCTTAETMTASETIETPYDHTTNTTLFPDEYSITNGPIRSLAMIPQKNRDLTTTDSGSHNRIIMHARTTLYNLDENHDIGDDAYFFFEDCFKSAFEVVQGGDGSTNGNEQDGSFHLRSFIVQQTTTAMDGDNRRQLQSQPDKQDDDDKNKYADKATEMRSRLRGGLASSQHDNTDNNHDTVVEHSNRELAWPFSFKKKKLLDILSLVEGSCGYSCDPDYDDDNKYDDDDGWYTKRYDDDDDGWYTRRDLDGSNTTHVADDEDEISLFEEVLLDMLRQGPFEVFHELEKVDVIFGP